MTTTDLGWLRSLEKVACKWLPLTDKIKNEIQEGMKQLQQLKQQGTAPDSINPIAISATNPLLEDISLDMLRTYNLVDDMWKLYEGSLPLEIAILTKQHRLVTEMMREMKGDTGRHIDFLSIPQTDVCSETNKNMRERMRYPLYLAALEGDIETMKSVLSEDSRVGELIDKDMKNSSSRPSSVSSESDIQERDDEGDRCDNIIHVLIKQTGVLYSHGPVYVTAEDQLQELKGMVKQVENNIRQSSIEKEKLNLGEVVLWLLEWELRHHGPERVRETLSQRGTTNLRPLQLAVKYGAYRIVEAIINYAGVYDITNSTDIIQGIKRYNVMDIETSYENHCINRHKKCKSWSCYQWQRDTNCLHQLKACKNLEGAYKIVELPLFKDLITKRWQHYRKSWTAILTFHLILMCAYTGIMNHRFTYTDGSNYWTSYPNLNSSSINLIEPSECYEIVCWLAFCAHFAVNIWGGLMLLLLLSGFGLLVDRKRKKLKEKTKKQSPWKEAVNTTTRGFADAEFSLYLTMFLFSAAAIADLAVHWYAFPYEPIVIAVVLVTGWWVILSFARPFSVGVNYFSCMINQSLTADLVKFLFVYCLLLVGFSNAMYIAFQTSTDRPSAFGSFLRTTYTMVKFSLGLNDIEDITDAQYPELVYSIAITYLLLTYLLLLNFLLAIINHNYGSSDSIKHPMYTLNQNGTIAFLELRRRFPHYYRCAVETKPGVREYTISAEDYAHTRYIDTRKVMESFNQERLSTIYPTDEQVVDDFIYQETGDMPLPAVYHAP